MSPSFLFVKKIKKTAVLSPLAFLSKNKNKFFSEILAIIEKVQVIKAEKSKAAVKTLAKCKAKAFAKASAKAKAKAKK